MCTIGESLRLREAGLFLGRERELEYFEDWLRKELPYPEIINLVGPAGIGKSALLRELEVSARTLRQVQLIDVSDVDDCSRVDLADALAGVRVHAVEFLNTRAPLLILDGVRTETPLADHLLRVVFPRLDSGVRIVLASRKPLRPGRIGFHVWHLALRSMPLAGLSDAHAHTLLRRLGVDNAAVGVAIVTLARGNPLTLSSAANLAVHLGQTGPAFALIRPLIVREAAEGLLGEVDEPEFQVLASRCAVLRHFDEETLVDIAGSERGTAAFRVLCQLSMVQATPDGLTFEPGASEILSEDFRWRRPAEFRDLTTQRRLSDRSRSIQALRLPPLADGAGDPPPQSSEPRQRVTPLHDVAGLTAREREVLELLARGHLSGRELAERLVIGVGTANLHVKHVLRKVGFGNRSELATWWREQAGLQRVGRETDTLSSRVGPGRRLR